VKQVGRFIPFENSGLSGNSFKLHRTLIALLKEFLTKLIKFFFEKLFKVHFVTNLFISYETEKCNSVLKQERFFSNKITFNGIWL